MPLVPIMPKSTFKIKKCAKCGIGSTTDDFTKTHSILFPDEYLPICNACINEQLDQNNFEQEAIDKLCQWADIPFIVREQDRLVLMNGQENTQPVYARVFNGNEYEGIGQADYYKQYKKLREAGLIETEIPLLDEQRRRTLQKKQGSNYSDDELDYLEDLYSGLLQSQNINGVLQDDQAKKICKFSLEIDSRIRAGDKEVDKFLSSYDKLVKIAEFTPKNTKNAIDFDSFAEVGKWLEKRGRQNKFYDGATRDVIDETLKNIENYNQRLYVNEGGIGDEITQRLQALQVANQKEESVFHLNTEYDLDEYDNDGFIMADEQEEFIIDEGDDEE